MNCRKMYEIRQRKFNFICLGAVSLEVHIWVILRLFYPYSSQTQGLTWITLLACGVGGGINLINTTVHSINGKY